MRTQHVVRLTFSAALCAALFLGCSESDVGGGGTPTTPLDTSAPQEDTAGTEPDTEAPDTAQPPDTAPSDDMTLDFAQAIGDDQQPCAGTARCTISLSFNEKRDLRVLVRRGGQPAEYVTVTWEILKNPDNKLKLSSFSSPTSPDGTTSVQVSQIDPAKNAYEVLAKLDGTNVQPKVFDVVVTPKGVVPLVVNYKYDKAPKFDIVTTLLFKHPQEGAKPLCSTLTPDTLPTATVQSPGKPLGQSAHFPSLPGLETELEQQYTVVGIGTRVNDPKALPMVWGCDDTAAKVSVNGGATVLINLQDLPPKWKGSYTITTQFDLVSAVPGTAGKIIDIIVNLFADTSGEVLALICEFGGSVSVLSQICGQVFVDDPATGNPKICLEDACFTGIGLALKGLLNNLLKDLTKDTVAGNILTAGGDIAKILKDLELTATFTFKKDPAPDGTFTAADTVAEWHSLTYRWSLGGNCDPQDPDACKYTFNLAAAQGGQVITGSFGGHFEMQGEKAMLTIEPHSLNIAYGKLILYLVEQIILPRLAGDGSDGKPGVYSVEDFVKSLVGGKECLILNDCCVNFAESVTNSVSGLTHDLAKAGCDALLSSDGVTPSLLEAQIQKLAGDLDLGTGGALTFATQTPCPCEDKLGNDLKIDTWGSKGAGACHWATVVTVGGGSTNIENDFWGVEEE